MIQSNKIETLKMIFNLASKRNKQICSEVKVLDSIKRKTKYLWYKVSESAY